MGSIIFDEVLSVRGELEIQMGIIDQTLVKIKAACRDVVNSRSPKEYIFGVDSLNHHKEMIDAEYKHLSASYKTLENRIYCEYYTLYQMIKSYGNSEIVGNISAKFSTEFPPYKHLDQSKVYDMSMVKKMHINIQECILELEKHLLEKNSSQIINTDIQAMTIGNVIHTDKYTNAVFNAKVELFKKYIEIYNVHHHKYYTQFLLKARLHILIDYNADASALDKLKERIFMEQPSNTIEDT